MEHIYKRYIPHYKQLTDFNFEGNCTNLSFMIRKGQLHQSEISYIQNFRAACVQKTDWSSHTVTPLMLYKKSRFLR